MSQRTKYTILAVVVVFLVGFGAFLLFRSGKPAEATATIASAAVLVAEASRRRRDAAIDAAAAREAARYLEQNAQEIKDREAKYGLLPANESDQEKVDDGNDLFGR